MINIELFKKALESEIQSGKWAVETKEIFVLGMELLSQNHNEELDLETREKRIAEIAIGTIITGIAYHNYKYSKDPIQGKFLARPELHSACKIEEFWEKLKEIKDDNERNKRMYTEVINCSGAKIFANDLSFDQPNLTTRFPQLENFFHIIDIMRNGQYSKIEDEFDKALKHWESNDLTDDKNKYMQTLAQLKKHVLEQFKAGTKEFDYEKCLGLAKRTEELTQALVHNDLTEESLKEYQRCNKIFFKENSPAMKALHVILSVLLIAAAAIAGAAVGFFAAGPVGVVPGAAVGATVGVTALTALGIYGFYARKSNPLVQLEDAAAEVVNNTPAGFNL